ncbi:hypothetical protein GCM10009347_40940 [Shewanella algicola]|uniref:YbjN domain-containing protein n=1 Tax=Shewanella algicola TaxID=640633 RepID=A0A9X2CCB6_9GAMM|nr:hypothetical protein [Shewanella algicola]MCL1107694.1 hypothetical protein [Shewanella algicola]GGP71924.1 hypothetical protein GCM10009347_40940 [Shewanella algicola]
MTNKHEDFLAEVLLAKKENTEIPEIVSSEVFESITTQELVDIINEFSFSNAQVSLAKDDSMFSVDIEFGRVLFFSNARWSASNGEEFFGIMATLPIGFDLDFISKFNQNTKIGRLYTIDKNSETTVYRVDVHMNGGVTKRNIYYMINTFIHCYKHLFSGLISNEGVYEH